MPSADRISRDGPGPYGQSASVAPSASSRRYGPADPPATGQRGPVAADPGARALRPGQRQAVGVDGEQGVVVAQQHRPIPFGRNGHPARPQAVEHVARLVPLALDPGRRAPRRGVRSRLVPVAAADRDRRRIPGQPPGQRRVQRRSSQLQCQTSSSGGRRRIGRVQLTGPANGWLTDSSPPAASVASSQASGSWRKSIQPTSPSAPACPPSVVTSWPGSRMIPYRRDAAASSAWWLTVLWSVTARKSSPRPAARTASSGDGQLAVRVHGVRVQVAGQPAAARNPDPAGRIPARRPVPRGRRRERGPCWAERRVQGRGRRRGLRGQPVAHAIRRDAVHADHHLPGAGLELPGQVAGRGRVAGDDERLAGAARPAAEPARAETAQVEHGPGGTVVVELHPQPARPRRHLHRQVVPGGREPVLQRPPPGVPYRVRHATSPPDRGPASQAAKFHQLLTYSPERFYRAWHEGDDGQGVPGTRP